MKPKNPKITKKEYFFENMNRMNFTEGTNEEKIQNYTSLLEGYSRLFRQKVFCPEEIDYHIEQILQIFVSLEKELVTRFDELPEFEQKKSIREFAEFRAKVKSWKFDQPVTKIVK